MHTPSPGSGAPGNSTGVCAWGRRKVGPQKSDMTCGEFWTCCNHRQANQVLFASPQALCLVISSLSFKASIAMSEVDASTPKGTLLNLNCSCLSSLDAHSSRCRAYPSAPDQADVRGIVLNGPSILPTRQSTRLSSESQRMVWVCLLLKPLPPVSSCMSFYF